MVPTKELQTFRTSTRGITCHKINPPALPDVFALMTLDYNVLLTRASTSTLHLSPSFFFPLPPFSPHPRNRSHLPFPSRRNNNNNNNSVIYVYIKSFPTSRLFLPSSSFSSFPSLFVYMRCTSMKTLRNASTKRCGIRGEKERKIAREKPVRAV